ncbi:hypothetical protein N7494_002922 [Penicillium frequentans]|uniref:Uncharacterized protein n=1 Tax=Penicillium frequentans TaxID=3151616 RepID=A0AAD6D4T2_9EURO|nr:hypothetical protein N7494_002922 [Penicillium glabrum]
MAFNILDNITNIWYGLHPLALDANGSGTCRGGANYRPRCRPPAAFALAGPVDHPLSESRPPLGDEAALSRSTSTVMGAF